MTTKNAKKMAIALWSLAALLWLGGFAGLYQGGEFMSVRWETWYWNALVLGVLAIGMKLGVLIMMKEEKR